MQKDKEAPKDRRADPRRSEKAPSEKPVAAAAAPAKDRSEKAASVAAASAVAGSVAAALARKSSEPAVPAKERPRAAAGGAGPERIGGYSRPANPVVRVVEGLSEEALQQIAQAKFEAQEERLKDVVRFSMVLLRDFAKLSLPDRVKRAADAQKALLKYEMQFTRAWGYTEQRRKAEVTRLEGEAERCRQAAAAEELQIVELRRILENEQRRRERYEGYEATAAEVNRKRSREEYKSAIADTKQGIEELKRRRTEHDALIEERMQRAQLLAQAVAELKQDLLKERDNLKDILKGTEEPAEVADRGASPSPEGDLVEVVS